MWPCYWTEELRVNALMVVGLPFLFPIYEDFYVQMGSSPNLCFVFEERQLRNLEKTFGGDVRVCDRTALILDIFNQRAATREAALQVLYTDLCLQK